MGAMFGPRMAWALASSVRAWLEGQGAGPAGRTGAACPTGAASSVLAMCLFSFPSPGPRALSPGRPLTHGGVCATGAGVVMRKRSVVGLASSSCVCECVTLLRAPARKEKCRQRLTCSLSSHLPPAHERERATAPTLSLSFNWK